MKRKMAMLMAAVLTASSLLAGCGSTAETDTSGSASDTSSEAASSSETTEQGDPDKIIVTYLYQTSTPTDLEKVQDAVNEITIPAINVEVEFKTLGIGDSFTNYSLWISSGETVDLMMLAFQDVKTYANSGQIECLDQWINEEDTPTLYSLSQEYPILTKVGTDSYGLSPVMANYPQQMGLIIREEWLNECTYEEKDIYTMEDLANVFQQIKENHPDVYPLIFTGSDISSGSTSFTRSQAVDLLGSNVLAGALMSMDSTEVVNLFETQEYQDYLQLMSDWYQAGYIVPDAATTDTSGQEMMISGKGAAYFMSQQPGQFSVDYGFDITGMPTTDGYLGATSNTTNWTVPVTSSNPEAAIRFMEYLYSDYDLSNLITFGIVGEHIQMVDEEAGVITFADGLDGNTSPYYNTLGFWGNRIYEYTWEGSVTREENQEWNEQFTDNKFKSYGFVFDSADVNNQILACQTVLDQYQKALETGTLGDDWRSTYETMVSQLESAGINEIIEACQTQFDAYLAQ